MADTRAPSFLHDWITVWHSELTALAADRELHEAAQQGVDAWARQAYAAASLLTAALDPAGRPGPDAPPRSPPAAAAPDGRDAELRRLHDRIAELERRLGPG